MAFNQQEQQIIQWGLQNGKSKEEVTQAISNLRNGIVVNQPKPEEKPNYFQRVGQDFQRAGERIKTGIGESAQQISTGASEILSGNIKSGVKDIQTGAGRAALRTVGSIAGAAFAPVVEAPGIKQATEAVAGGAMKIPAVQTLAQKGAELAQKYPDASKDIEDLINIATLGVGGAAEKPIQGAVSDLTKGVKDITQKTASETVKIGKKIVPKSPEIMNKVARLTPTQARNFKNLAGETQGEYLVRTGNFGTPQEIVEKEAQKFSQSIKSVDDTLATLPGEYKAGVIDDTLKALQDKVARTSTENVPSPIASRVAEFANKNETVGLNMSEINEVKRLYEREVKLGYNKLMNPDAVQTATNVDNALREWQFSKAKELGFENIDELNKQTQISRNLLNSLGDQIVGKNGLNNISLTDWIVLSGGDPTAVGGLIVKKFFGSKAVQSKIAKMLSDVKPEGIKKPVITPSKQELQPQSKIKSEKALPKSSTTTPKKSSPKGKGTIPENSLIQEAKKYKSADEFVNAQGTPIYRGEGGSNVAQGKALLAEGKHFASDSKYPQGFGNVSENIIKPSAKVLDLGDSTFAEISQKLGIPERRYISPKELSTIAKEKGYDVLKYSGEYKSTGKQFTHFVDLTGDSTITKSQLEEIWKKANKK